VAGGTHCACRLPCKDTKKTINASRTFWNILVMFNFDRSKKSNFILLSNINFPLIIIKNIILQF